MELQKKVETRKQNKRYANTAVCVDRALSVISFVFFSSFKNISKKTPFDISGVNRACVKQISVYNPNNCNEHCRSDLEKTANKCNFSISRTRIFE